MDEQQGALRVARCESPNGVTAMSLRITWLTVSHHVQSKPLAADEYRIHKVRRNR
jgi:hypothetical protein